MTNIHTKPHLLKKILFLLTEEWGYETVRHNLENLEKKQRGRPDPHPKKDAAPREYRRPTAVEIVERLEVLEQKKDLLLSLAKRFDAKVFLPTISDVRQFLEERGYDPGPIKQRQDSFKKLLNAFIVMENDELVLFKEREIHSGPSQLGPLSDAIRSTSAAIRGSEAYLVKQSSDTYIDSTDADDSK